MKTKGPDAAPAKDLYTSPLWQGRRSYAESTGQPWAILSAEHGLLDPDEVIDPYERSLGGEPLDYRRRWHRTTAEQVIDRCRQLGVGTVEIHAGEQYVDGGLRTALQRANIEVLRPLEGLQIGQQLAWYAGTPDPPTPAPLPPLRDVRERPVEPTGRHAEAVAAIYRSRTLGETWSDLPEGVNLPDAPPRDRRLFLTFGATVDRARDAARLWASLRAAWEAHPWMFDPAAVAAASVTALTDVLRSTGASQRHSVDAFAWRTVAETLAAADCPDPVRRVIDGDSVDAADLLEALRSATAAGTPRFPLLSGPKIGPMWVRFMAWPGLSPVRGLAVIPVAVDTHVQRVTEMLGLVHTARLDERHRRAVADAWFEAVGLAGDFGAPPELGTTAAALDPALWALGKEGCSRCERAGRLIPVGEVCKMCVGGRLG